MSAPLRNKAPLIDIEEGEILSRSRPLRDKMTEVQIPPAPASLTTKRLEAATNFCFCDSRYGNLAQFDNVYLPLNANPFFIIGH